MAHFAKVENGVVTQIIVVGNGDCGGGQFPESEAIGKDFISGIGLSGEFFQCSYSGSFRGGYPGPGWTYDSEVDKFVAPAATIEETP